MSNEEKTSGKTIAIVSYMTIVGTLIALTMNGDAKSEFASFHIRQSLGLSITFFAFAYPAGLFDDLMITGSLYLCFFILWIYGYIGALMNEKRLIPLVGTFYQTLFKSL